MNPSTQPGDHWQYKPEDPNQAQQPEQPYEDGTSPDYLPTPTDIPSREVVWTASEFIAHEKTPGWYLTLAGGTIVVAIIIFFITRDRITTGFILLAAIFFGVGASRKPKQVRYQIDEQGISIGDRFTPYHEFRSFSIIQDGAFSSIVFLPLKRFALLTSAYIDPKDEDAIIDIVADSLPIEDHSHDPIEKLMRRIRF